MNQRIVGVLGGSGLYDVEGLEVVSEHRVETPFGAPSDVIVEAARGDTRYLFLPRHGRGHRIPPHQLNARANVHALKSLGAEQVVAISAVGSLREDYCPGDAVLVDQFIDRTRSGPHTFFEDGIVAHVEFAEPTDRALTDAVDAAAKTTPLKVHRGGTYVCIDGPQFSTRAESRLYRSWGADVIGMTALPEARLSREAQLPFSLFALVTDYDAWKDDVAAVSTDAVLAVLARNVTAARQMLAALQPPDPSKSPATRALAHAVMTHSNSISEGARARVATLLPRGAR
jgi:5'-methylthioadenosine phosphorylase